MYFAKTKIGRAKTKAELPGVFERHLQKLADSKLADSKLADTDLKVPFCSAVLCSAANMLLLDVMGPINALAEGDVMSFC